MATYEGKEESLQFLYNERISELQYQETPFSVFHLYQGFWYNQNLLERIMSLQDNFCAKSTNIILSSFPKSGTTWLKALTFAITTRAKFDISSSPLLNTMPHDCVSFLENDHVSNSYSLDSDLELPLLATHIPYPSLPRSIITSGCKIVYIYRDPKDVLVSMWHFMSTVIPEGMAPPSLDVFFELFSKGFCPFGSYWDHVLSYWKASFQRPGTTLILKYDDLMIDTEFYVKKIAEFMGCAFSVEEEKDGVVEKLVKLCSFESLSNLNVNKTGKCNIYKSRVFENKLFFRKGQSGGWKNYLSTEMAEKIDKISEEKFASIGLMVPSNNCHYVRTRELE